MSKNDYEIIARAIRSEIDRHDDIDLYKSSSVLKWVVANLSHELGLDNDRFDSERFIEATGIRSL